LGKKCAAVNKLLSEGWFDTEKDARAWIMERNVLVNEQLVFSPNDKIPIDGIVRLKKDYKRKYVNKGGLKLEKCIDSFQIDLNNRIALDCGASTGGFTDCLLQKGAKMVYAVDVGFGQLAGRLAADPRVVNLEKTNLGDEMLMDLKPKPDIITLDLSYLSLKKAVPISKNILKGNGIILCLVKPLFEVESKDIRRSGEINDRRVLNEILLDLCTYFDQLNFKIIGITNSSITGNTGTLEYFIGLSCEQSEFAENNSFTELVRIAVESSFQLELFKK
jgi:23S rRNA (cytidine1920-2'-O)/16S rRNA (cytidine1409-2'-O)-methyltransferase